MDDHLATDPGTPGGRCVRVGGDEPVMIGEEDWITGFRISINGRRHHNCNFSRSAFLRFFTTNS